VKFGEEALSPTPSRYFTGVALEMIGTDFMSV